RLAADLDLGARARARGAQGALELLALRRRPDDAEPALRAQQPPRPPRLRPVDEELRQLVRRRRRGLRDEREEAAHERLDPLSGRAGNPEDAGDPLVCDPE